MPDFVQKKTISVGLTISTRVKMFLRWLFLLSLINNTQRSYSVGVGTSQPCPQQCSVCIMNMTGAVSDVECTDVFIQKIPNTVRNLYVHNSGANNPIPMGLLLPFIFENKTNLVTLKITEYKLRRLVGSPLKDMKSLMYLDLSINHISSITSSSFTGLVSLKKLYLSANWLRHLTDNSFSNLMELNTLSLDRNMIESITMKAFVGLQKLKTLNLMRNRIGNIDPVLFKDTTSIQDINLSFNVLWRITDTTFQNMSHLHVLNFQKNIFSVIQRDAFLGTNLESLDLSLNNFRSVPQAMLAQQSPLLNVSLTANRIQRLSNLDFNGLKLNKLDLRMNNITFIDGDAFDQSNIREVDLRRNHLSSLQQSNSRIFTRTGTSFHLEDNPWDCNCDWLWFQQVRNQSHMSQDLVCQSPLKYKGVNMSQAVVSLEVTCLTTTAVSTNSTSQHQCSTIKPPAVSPGTTANPEQISTTESKNLTEAERIGNNTRPPTEEAVHSSKAGLVAGITVSALVVICISGASLYFVKTRKRYNKITDENTETQKA